MEFDEGNVKCLPFFWLGGQRCLQFWVKSSSFVWVKLSSFFGWSCLHVLNSVVFDYRVRYGWIIVQNSCIDSNGSGYTAPIHVKCQPMRSQYILCQPITECSETPQRHTHEWPTSRLDLSGWKWRTLPSTGFLKIRWFYRTHWNCISM